MKHLPYFDYNTEALTDIFTRTRNNQKYNKAEDDSKPKGKKPRKEDFNEQRNRKRGLDGG